MKFQNDYLKVCKTNNSRDRENDKEWHGTFENEKFEVHLNNKFQ